jgi:hypothetical protein
MLSLKSSKAVSINSARHFHSSISISPGTRRISADGRQQAAVVFLIAADPDECMTALVFGGVPGMAAGSSSGDRCG